MPTNRTLVWTLVMLFSIVLALNACKKESDTNEAPENVSEEATTNLRRLADSSVSYYYSEHVTAMGASVPSQFPESSPMTPAEVPCGEAHTPTQAEWFDRETWTWEALNFAMSDPHYYAYQYDSSGTRGESTFTATAFGDVDCDGELSTFVRTGHIVDREPVLSELESTNPDE